MDVEKGEGVWRWRKDGDYIYLSLHCHHQNDFCIKRGSDESHFSISVGSDGQSHKTHTCLMLKEILYCMLVCFR